MKLNLLITTFNRPAYLEKCFNSLMKVKYPDGCSIMIVDDASSDQKTIDLINEFNPSVNVQRFQNSKNSGIRQSIKFGYDKAFESAEIVINLDGDMIVKPDFIVRLLELKKQFPDNIVSGINCTMLNARGEQRNPIIKEHEGYSLKQAVAGQNLCINKDNYEKYIKPILSIDGNWDHNASIASMKDKKPIVVCVPSVSQHIGMNSSMGHSIYEPADRADDYKMLSLSDVTLLGTDAKNPRGIKRAAEISQRDISFGDVKIITDTLYDGREDYSKYYIKELNSLVDTSHVLIIHYDGYILNWEAWDNSWLQYDYIGALWEWYKDDKMNGNGGFSLRSKRLLEVLANDDVITEFHPEDHVICRTYRRYLEKTYDIKFAPDNVCRKFSIEAYNSNDRLYKGQFGFHGFHCDLRDVHESLRPQRFDFNKMKAVR